MISGAELLKLEQEARRAGSGIAPETIIGEWWLQQLWGRQGQVQGAAAALLRSLSACLAITEARAAEAGSAEARPDAARTDIETRRMALELRNSVRLGPLELRFTGPGRLCGRRPLLRFHFERMQLLWLEKPLWEASLPPPAADKEPFFALIAAGPDRHQGAAKGWLAARGRGGGLALWSLTPV